MWACNARDTLSLITYSEEATDEDPKAHGRQNVDEKECKHNRRVDISYQTGEVLLHAGFADQQQEHFTTSHQLDIQKSYSFGVSIFPKR